MISQYIVNGETVPVYDVFTFPYQSISSMMQRKDGSSRKKRAYRLEYGAFDIETTSHIERNEENGLEGYGYMYIWQFCSAGAVCIGRKWDEFILLLKKINLHLAKSGTAATFVIFVHNLSFEFAFMSGILTQADLHFDVFATRNRKVLTCRLQEIQIEFRCSLKLTNRSLKKLLHDNPTCGFDKMVGDLDYKVKRTPLSNLTDREMGYCIVDVLGLYRALKSEMQRTGDNIATLPLTSTGFIRRRLRQKTDGIKSYRKLVEDMAMTPAQYALARRCAKGGDTLASMSQPIGVIHTEGDSFDIKSSYPARLVNEPYPISPFREETEVNLDLIKQIEEEGDYYITEIYAKNVRLINSIQPIPCISAYKTDVHSPDAIIYNGRILQTEYLYMAFDMPSFQLFRNQYTWDEIQFGETYSCQYGLLPDCFRDFVMEVFKGKCELEYQIKYSGKTKEETADLEQDYDLYKNLLNGIFGMCYTNPLHEDFCYDPDSFTWLPPGELDLDDPKTIKKLMTAQHTAVAPYIWGIHTASLGRVALDQLINTVGWYNTWYCDTDSNKCKHSPEIRARVNHLNEALRAKAEEAGGHVRIKDKEFYLGVIECETENDLIQEFRTQGAKKYVYRLSDGLHMTLSGVEKDQVVQLQDDINNFAPGFVFNPAGGITLHYMDNPPHLQHVKGDDGTECDIWLASNIVCTDRVITLGHIVDQSRKLQGTDRITEFEELCEMMELQEQEEI